MEKGVKNGSPPLHQGRHRHAPRRDWARKVREGQEGQARGGMGLHGAAWGWACWHCEGRCAKAAASIPLLILLLLVLLPKSASLAWRARPRPCPSMGTGSDRSSSQELAAWREPQPPGQAMKPLQGQAHPRCRGPEECYPATAAGQPGGERAPKAGRQGAACLPCLLYTSPSPRDS